MSSILSIDYGTKRIGLAVSDPKRIFAFPAGVIQNDNMNKVILEIKKIIFEKEVDLILVGMPYDLNANKKLDSEPGNMMKTVQKFVKRLQAEVNINVETIDETLSSFAAEENLRESGVSSKRLKEFVDQEAARLILEEYMKKNII